MKPESDCGNTREGGCARLESGTAFMPGASEKRLEKAARREKDKCAKFRLLACLGRKKGHSIRRISRDLKTAYSTIRDWLLRMRDRGLKGRFDARPKGRRAKLPLQIIRTVRRWLKRSPKKCGFGTGSWQMDMVTEMIRIIPRILVCAFRARTVRAHGYQVAEEVMRTEHGVASLAKLDPQAREEKRTHQVICRLHGDLLACLFAHA